MADPDVQKIGKYEIQAELGQGGFGRVYRAFDPTVGRLVAIKILTAEGNRDVLTRFRNEATAAGNLKHRNIVTVYDFGEYNGRPYLVMEFLEGEDLLQVINRGAQLTLLQKMNIMEQVAEGLDCAHRNGVVHRDVKPANIRLLPDGTVKIMDFGVARVNRDRDATRLTQQGDLIGTVLYMSPEQFGGAEADSLCDIFAYGVTYFELLTGKHPFRSSDPRTVMFKITMEDPEPVRKLVAECPEGLEQILNRALQKDRELRYQSLRDLKLDAEPLIFELQRDEATRLIADAQALSDGNDAKASLEKINEALNLDPTNRDARQLRDLIQRRLQKEALLPRIESMLQNAQELMASRAFSQAVQALESANRLDHTDLRIQALLETARAELQRTKDAARLAIAALADLDRGEFSTAEEKASEAARLDPANKEAARVIAAVERERSVRDLLSRADSLINAGDLDAAIVRLEEAAALRPQSKEIQTRLDEVFARKRALDRIHAALERARDCIDRLQFGHAIEVLNAALQDFPEDQALLALRGRAEEGSLAQKRHEEIDNTARGAESLLEAEKFDEAIQLLQRALDAYPGEPKLTALAATAAAGKVSWERRQRAHAARQQADEAKALVDQGRPDQAVVVLENACDQFPEEHQLRELLVQAREELRLAQRRQAIHQVTQRSAELAGRKSYREALEAIQAVLVQHGEEPALAQLQQSIQEQWTQQQRAEAALQSVEKGRVLLGQDALEASKFLETATLEFPEQGQLKELLSEAQERVRVQQRNQAVEAAVREAAARAEQKDYARTQKILEKALKAWPDEPRLLDALQKTNEARARLEREKALGEITQKGEQLARDQRYREALETVQAGLALYENEPALVQLQQRIQEQWTRQQRVEAALQSVQEARSLLQDGRAEQAIAVLEQAQGRYPEAEDLPQLLAEAREKMRFEQRVQAIREIVERGEQLGRDQRYREALEAVQAGLASYENEPALVQLQQRIQEQWTRQQRVEAALQSVQEARSLLQDGRTEQAIAVLEQAHDRYPEDEDLPHLLAEAREKMRFEQRVQAIREIVERGEQLARDQRYREALETVQAGLASYENEPALVQLQQRIQEQWTRQQRAEAIRQSVEEGRGLLAQGHLDQALEALRKAAAKYPEEELRKLLAEVQEQLHARQRNQAVEAALSEASGRAEQKDFSQAVKVLEKALKSWPGESRLLERLQTTKDAKVLWAREKAVRDIAQRCKQLERDTRYREALDTIEAGLAQYKDEPALTQLRQQVREQLELQQRAEAANRIAKEARQLLEQGRAAQAVEVLERAAVEYAEDEPLRRLLAQAQEALQTEQRRMAVEAAAREAETRWAQKDFPAALTTLEQALGSWPSENRLTELLPKIKADQAQWERQQEIEKVLRECDQFGGEQRFTEALAIVQAVLERLGQDPALAQRLHWLEEQLALQHRAEAIRQQVEEGRQLLKQGRPEEALQVFEKAWAQHPGEEVLSQWLTRAKADLEEKQRIHAIEMAIQAAASEANERAERQDYAGARSVLSRALQSWPGDSRLVQLWQKTAEAQARLERQQAVIQASEEATRLLEQDQPQKAIDVLEQASARYQGEEQLRQLLAAARERLRVQRHREAVEKAAQEAVARAEQRDFARALKLVEKALKSWPGESRLVELQRTIKESRAQWERQQRAEAAAVGPAVAQEPAPSQPVSPVASIPSKKPSRLVLAGIAAAVLLVGGAVVVPRLLRSPRGIPVSITANLAGASVKVGDQACVTPLCALTLAPGTYQLTATRAGYRSLNRAVSIKAGGADLAVPLVFEPLPEMVQVNTNFASGKVFFDGKPAGDLRDGQLGFSNVPPGRHTVRVTGGDAEFEAEWRSEPGNAPEIAGPLSAKNVQATVVANAGETGSVACNCDVSTIQVDGKPAGSAPGAGGVTLPLKDLKEGARRISAADRSLLVDVRPNPALTIQLSLDRNVGTLVIVAGQDNAKVFLNGRPYRRTTEHGTLRVPADVGEYSIQVQKEGFRASEPQKVALNKGEEKQVSFSLTPVPPSLEISGALAGAQVKVDGRVIGETGANGALRAELSPGNHDIELTKEDYTSARFTAQFPPGARVRTSPEQVAMAKIVPPQPPPARPGPDPKQLEAQDWERVRGSNSISEVDDFIRKHPGGAHLDEARDRVSRLRQELQAETTRLAEQAAWDAVDKSKKAALQDFLSRYSGGAHSLEARGLIGEIDKREAEAIASQRAKDAGDQEQSNRAQADEQSITRALSAFESAYNAKDLPALRTVWPGMPKNVGDTLNAQFRYAKSLTFRIRQSGPPVIAGDTASVPCTRALDVVTRDGQKAASGDERVRVTLERTGATWAIRSIASN